MAQMRLAMAWRLLRLMRAVDVRQFSWVLEKRASKMPVKEKGKMP
jgi:hypothetical protein